MAQKRGAVAANGVPADTGNLNIAASIAADKALSDNPTTFQLMIGAKKYTEQEIKQGELVMHENKLWAPLVIAVASGRANHKTA